MHLTTGQRLGDYEILGPIGAGGMGEVYRAHDTSLDRDVAIKVLPLEVAEDPDRWARFEREALDWFDRYRGRVSESGRSCKPDSAVSRQQGCPDP
ncbi:MAG: hypothetical protein MUP13_14150 [Thermoanaerobaculales bacterium]|nr:hypothetical protein [Thermoanaerobaculales bacterium]